MRFVNAGYFRTEQRIPIHDIVTSLEFPVNGISFLVCHVESLSTIDSLRIDRNQACSIYVSVETQAKRAASSSLLDRD